MNVFMRYTRLKMVNLIPVPQVKYQLLRDVRQNRWKNHVLCLALSLVLVGSIFVMSAWIYIPTISKFFIGSSKSFESQPIPTRDRSDEYHRDGNIASWLRRTKIYAQSTQENQNADRNATIAKSQHSNVGATSQIVVCYYTIPREQNSSWELHPSHIDPCICTHIIVGFASVVDSKISLGGASWIYESVARLKSREPGLKVMLSAGGMNEVERGFPLMVKTHTNRKRFIRSVLDVANKLNLDGLDVDWEFPAWLVADDRQRKYFVQLLQELRREFDRSSRELLLSIAVAAPTKIVDQSYNIPEIAKHVDFVCLMSYDYHFYVWYFPVTGHNAPLYPRSAESGYVETLNVNYSAMYWLAKGMPREKLVIGIPTYGHSYVLDNPLNHDLLAPAKGFGKLGMSGFVSYPGVCSFLKFGATRCFDRESKVPYAYKYDEWVSYEDVASVRQKAEWIKANGFAGGMVFSLNEDDWNASCLDTETDQMFPLTRAIVKVLRASGID